MCVCILTISANTAFTRNHNFKVVVRPLPGYTHAVFPANTSVNIARGSGIVLKHLVLLYSPRNICFQSGLSSKQKIPVDRVQCALNPYASRRILFRWKLKRGILILKGMSSFGLLAIYLLLAQHSSL
jgi:hypothetical protein